MWNVNITYRLLVYLVEGKEENPFFVSGGGRGGAKRDAFARQMLEFAAGMEAYFAVTIAAPATRTRRARLKAHLRQGGVAMLLACPPK